MSDVDEVAEAAEVDEIFPVRPLRDMMIVQDVRFDALSKIIMPDTAKSRLGSRYGRVVAIGPGLIHPVTGDFMPMGIEVGDVVQHREYSGTPFKHAGVPYLTVVLDDVVSVIDEARFDPITRLSREDAERDGNVLPGLGNKGLIQLPSGA